jgi:oligopeptide transport system substrate-binding protein
MHTLRRSFPYFAAALLIGALAWAMSFGTLPKADFTFDNSTEIETIDPALATGQPENRIINALFEGLLRSMPPKDWEEKYALQDNVPMTPQPAMAELPELSADGLTYTFKMRSTSKWSDGSRVTAEDFAWSWMRALHPETGARYSYQLYYLKGAQAYNLAQVAEGEPVEVELADRKNPLQLFPQGTVLRGRLKTIDNPPEPTRPERASDEAWENIQVDWKEQWVYTVEIGGKERTFSKGVAAGTERCLHVLPDFQATVGVKAVDPQTLVVTLEKRTPYFLDLVGFYPLYPVNRQCIESFGSPHWTRPENIVSNGAFTLKFRRIRDRIRLEKNPHYWDAANVHLNVVDALAVKGETTSLNMYLNGQVDWSTQMPINTIPVLKEKYADQFRSAPELTTYFYRLNVTRPELSDPKVRRALGMAIDKQAICERVARAGEKPAYSLCPPGMAGYTAPTAAGFNVEAAQALLAEAGYAGGRGLPTIEILYNDLDAHRTIAETVQQMWKEHLGIDAELRGLEWGVYLDTTHKLDYDVARAGWVADYPDPNTFLDMFVTGGEQNQTGWSNLRYDELLAQAAGEADPKRRMQLLHDAETILMDEQPIIPIYFRVSKNLVQPHVQGFFNNVQDEHWLKLIRVKKL